MSEMEALDDLRAELIGVRLLVHIALNQQSSSAKDAENILASLRRVEARMKKQNAHSRTIQTLREFREIWEQTIPYSGTDPDKA